MRATIKDVSRVAGVSIKTVSRVLNKERYVSAATREKVEAAVAELNFRPSIAARSLAGRRSFQIALICDNPSPYYVYEIQRGIRDRCETDGVRMIAQPYDRGSDGLLTEIEALVDTTHLDGVILTPPVSDHDGVLDLLARRQVRFVRVSPGDRPALASAAFIDNRRAAATMMAHLLMLGHRRIAHVAGPAEFAASIQRRAGYVDAVLAAGLALDDALIRPGAFDFASGAAAAAALFALPDPPTAIFAASDDMAAGVLATAHAAGLTVGGLAIGGSGPVSGSGARSESGAISVAGFGDDALAGYVWPPLTTIRQPVRALGWNAADLLLAPVEDGVERRELPFELVERASTALKS